MLTLRPYQKSIIRKTHQSMAAGNRRPLVVAPTGSGKTAMFAWMAAETQKKGKTVWFLVHRAELYDQTIETFDRFGIERKSIYVGMIRRQNKDFPEPDLIVFDEAHHSSAATWRRLIDRYPDCHMIGLTATPCRLDGAPLGEIYDDLIVGVSTADLIASGYLSNYDYYSVPVADLEGLKTRGKDYDAADSAARMITVCGDVVSNYKQRAVDLSAICFCASVDHSKEMAKAFRSAGIRAEHFDGDTPTKKRKELVSGFRSGDIQILTNVDLVGEGFDMPDCDCVIQLRPTQSLSLYLQQCGRALRPRDGKRAVILDHVGNYTRHGLPADHREWSLDTRVSSPATVSEQGLYLIRQCRECYACFDAKHDACPVCGAEYELTGLEIKNVKEIRLEKILAEEQRERDNYLCSAAAMAAARSYSDYCEIAKARGYKKGWARYQAKAAGYWVPY